MAGTTRSAVLEGKERLVVREFPLPEIGPDEALLRVERAGVCGTDTKYFHGKLEHPVPLVLGHEILGRIAQIGARAAERYGLQVGDRVEVESRVPCGLCHACHTGVYRYCQARRGYGTSISAGEPPHLWGAYGEHLYVAPGSIMHRVDPELPADAAAVIGIVANGIQWACYYGGVRVGDAVVVQGPGPEGLGCALAARQAGASTVVVTGLAADAPRLALARELGATHTLVADQEDVVARVRELTHGEGPQVVLDVTGSPRALPLSLEMVRRQGTVVLGGLMGTSTATSLYTDQFIWKEIRLQGVYTHSAESTRAAVKLVESRQFPLERMVTHHFSLDDAEQAVRAAGGELPELRPIKTVIVP
jgi:alcohol dehydrogenase